MTQKLISTGPGTFRRAERKEATDGLDRTSRDSLLPQFSASETDCFITTTIIIIIIIIRQFVWRRNIP